MSDLASRECAPCRGGVPPLEGAELDDYATRLGNDWQVVDGHHLDGASLEQTVGEPTGRRADVDASTAGQVDPERIERALELLPSSPDEAGRRRQDLDRIGQCNEPRRFLGDRPVDGDLARIDPATGLFAARRQLAANELADPQRAEAALRRAYDLDGGSGESRDRLKAHYEQHDMAAELADMLALDEEEAEEPAEKVVILKRIADLYSGPLGDPGAAATFLERASELDPEDRDVLLPLCDLYVAAGRQDDAIPVLEQIIASYGTRRNKEVAVYHHRLGLAKQSMGDLDGAMKSFDAAFKVDLTNVIVLRDLGRLCLDREDYDRAQKTFRALLLQKLRPEHGIAKADVYYYLGLISHKSGDERKAISMFERAIAEDKEHEDAAAMLAELKG